MLFERTVLAVFFVGVGAYGFVHSIHTGNGWLAAASAIESGLFYPALNSVQKIRRENQKIRLLELALTNAKTTDEAAAAVPKVLRKNLAIIGEELMLLGPTNTALDVAVLLERGFRDGSIALSNPADDIQPQRGTSVLPASDLSQPFDQRPNRWVRLALQFGVAGGIAVVVVAIRSLMLENIELAHRGGNFDWFHQFNGKLLLLVSIPSVLVGFHDLINGLEKFVAKRTIRRKS